VAAALPQVVQPLPPVTTTTPAPPPCAPGVQACVQLSTSQAWLIPPGGAVVGPVPIGYGVGAHATPTGTWPVAWKAEHYTSRTYHEPMPDAVFFAPGGIAFHAGSLDTSSHGCVHLDPATAAQFFAALQVGATVQVLP
jgi:lipoprotein-anchoring transpeptidase ErfK/SrfK